MNAPNTILTKQNNLILKVNQPLWTRDENDIYFQYYYLYPYLIYNIINNGFCNYEWMSFSSKNFLLKEDIAEIFFDVKNPYVTKNKNILFLAEDILKRGLYFPFIGYYLKNKQYFVRLGKHRSYSISNHPTCKNKDFLFIHIPKYTSDKYSFKNKIIIPVFYPDGKIILRLTNNSETIFQSFIKFSDHLGNFMYKNRDIIKPNNIFNNKILFENFLKVKNDFI